MKLSVVVITKNEEAVIARCLESVAWADEIVVVDSGSSDRTVDICRTLGAKVHITADWPGFGTQRNRAIDLSGGDWILALDADEWVPPALRDELCALMQTAPDAVAYRIARLSSYCGRTIRHGGWWPDHVSRLFKRGAARYGDHIVHEHLIVEGRLGTLREHLMHEAFTDVEEVLDKLNSYSSWGAQTLREKGRSGGIARAVAHGLWTFVRTYLLHAGFLDGREGFMLAVSNAEGAYYKYVKLMLLQRAAGKAPVSTR
jgi:glycosyltransferase involved in cell wall biosynthesis